MNPVAFQDLEWVVGVPEDRWERELETHMSTMFRSCACALFFETLDRYNSPHIFLGGDFNLAAHPALDRSKVVPSSKGFSKSINRSLNKFQLIVFWRAHNIGVKSYTYCSHPHDPFGLHLQCSNTISQPPQHLFTHAPGQTTILSL